ncbi:MAG TPA: TonB-dependent receptor [Bacteroidia bacterium]|nr:TonB-dependent receptor [Bacteroidia bacterium]
MKRTLLYFLLFITVSSYSQRLSVSGNLQDTTAKEPLQNAIVMAIKLMDSTLVDFTRTNKEGNFKLQGLPIDTYQVVISHPKFSDMGYFIFGDKRNLEYDFGKIILQPKNVSLDEVTIFAFKDPIYYKGDTLVYTADSFKTKANATVEDLLKKLPGLKVDKDGKITSQGKAVDKVLVDGDEFFGSDPTVATRNLNASSIESVQVYEKKSDDVANSSTGEETQKILNLKLKEEAKKGYFGKISGASDFQRFYEGEALGNYFKKKLKISVFGLASNTPNSSFSWDDVYKYGLNNEFERQENEDGGWMMTMTSNQPQGIPQNLKTGFYYTDKIFKNTKLNLNYTYSNSMVNSKTTKKAQYFLTDTSYTTDNLIESIQKNDAHAINIGIEQKVDSLTDIYFTSKIKKLGSNTSSNDETDFLRSDNVKTRNTSINSSNKSEGYDVSNNLKLVKRFKKKDRLLNVTYSNSLSETNTDGILKTDNYSYADSSEFLVSVNQKKTGFNNNQNHIAGVTFTEPITKKIKIEASYDYMYYKSKQNKQALNNIGGEYNQLDSTLTNNFENLKQINRAGLKFIYEVKKMRFTIGTKARNVFVNNNNIFKDQRITQNFNNVLPFSTIRYKFSDNKVLDVKYTTSSQNPTISQLQPVRDNSNPNFINIGNPNLLPTFMHSVNLNFNSWKSISGKYTWMGLTYNYTNNDIATATSYDSIGRTVSQAINVNGNYNFNGYIGTSMPFFSKKLEVGPNIWASYAENKTYINGLENNTQDIRSNVSLDLRLNFEKISAGVSGNYSYNSAYSSLNNKSNTPYSTQGMSGFIEIKFPKNFALSSDANYTINSKRSNGYNINYLVWNANLSKTFFKKENFILGVYAYDILNQNISVDRDISSNVVTDIKTNIISRYLLLKATFKFNSNKAKEEDEF